MASRGYDNDDDMHEMKMMHRKPHPWQKAAAGVSGHATVDSIPVVSPQDTMKNAEYICPGPPPSDHSYGRSARTK